MSGLARFDRVLAAASWVVAGLAVLMLLIGPKIVAEDEPVPAADAQPAGEEAADAEGEGDEAAAPDGAALFTDNCGSCHTLSAAGTSGAVGPSLDGAALDAVAVASIVTSGSGSMPSFSDSLDEAEIQAIADFVAGASQG